MEAELFCVDVSPDIAFVSTVCGALCNDPEIFSRYGGARLYLLLQIFFLDCAAQENSPSNFMFCNDLLSCLGPK